MGKKKYLPPPPNANVMDFRGKKPYEDMVNVLSWTVFGWLNRVIKLVLDYGTFYRCFYHPVRTYMMPKEAATRIVRAWNEKVIVQDKEPTLMRILIRANYKKYIYTPFMYPVMFLAAAIPPLCLWRILQYIEAYSTAVSNGTALPPLMDGLLWAIVDLLVEVFKVYIEYINISLVYNCSSASGAGLLDLLYIKMIQLSEVTRANSVGGSFVTMIIADALRTASIFQMISTVLMVPIQVVTLLIYLIIEVKLLSLLSVAFVCIVIPVLLLIMNSMYKVQKRMAGAKEARMRKASEVLQGISVIKYFCFEEVNEAKLRNAREQELKYNTIYSHASTTVNSIISCSGSMMALLTLGTSIAIESFSKQCGMSYVFTNVYTVTYLASCVLFIPQVFSALSESFISATRVECFLSLSTPDKGIMVRDLEHFLRIDLHNKTIELSKRIKREAIAETDRRIAKIEQKAPEKRRLYANELQQLQRKRKQVELEIASLDNLRQSDDYEIIEVTGRPSFCWALLEDMQIPPVLDPFYKENEQKKKYMVKKYKDYMEAYNYRSKRFLSTPKIRDLLAIVEAQEERKRKEAEEEEKRKREEEERAVQLLGKDGLKKGVVYTDEELRNMSVEEKVARKIPLTDEEKREYKLILREKRKAERKKKEQEFRARLAELEAGSQEREQQISDTRADLKDLEAQIRETKSQIVSLAKRRSELKHQLGIPTTKKTSAARGDSDGSEGSEDAREQGTHTGGRNLRLFNEEDDSDRAQYGDRQTQPVSKRQAKIDALTKGMTAEEKAKFMEKLAEKEARFTQYKREGLDREQIAQREAEYKEQRKREKELLEELEEDKAAAASSRSVSPTKGAGGKGGSGKAQTALSASDARKQQRIENYKKEGLSDTEIAKREEEREALKQRLRREHEEKLRAGRLKEEADRQAKAELDELKTEVVARVKIFKTKKSEYETLRTRLRELSAAETECKKMRARADEMAAEKARRRAEYERRLREQEEEEMRKMQEREQEEIRKLMEQQQQGNALTFVDSYGAYATDGAQAEESSSDDDDDDAGDAGGAIGFLRKNQKHRKHRRTTEADKQQEEDLNADIGIELKLLKKGPLVDVDHTEMAIIDKWCMELDLPLMATMENLNSYKPEIYDPQKGDGEYDIIRRMYLHMFTIAPFINDAVREKQKSKDYNLIMSIDPDNMWTSVGSGRGRVTADLPPALHDLAMTIRRNELIGICGPVASGKSSLFNALLGEMRLVRSKRARLDKYEGQIVNKLLLYGYPGETDFPQYSAMTNLDATKDEKLPHIYMRGTIAYHAQTPALFSGTIRDNILFHHPYDEEKYRRVCDVCCIEQDLQALPKGDQTECGERGTTLSGGQKARIALARAVYSDAEIYLLDDPLSAVDSHVGARMWEECILGYLKKKGATVLIASHQTQYFSDVDRVMYIEEGEIKAFDTVSNVLANGPQILGLTEKRTVTNKGMDTTKVEEAAHQHTDEADGTSKSEKAGAHATSQPDSDGTVPEEEDEDEEELEMAATAAREHRARKAGHKVGSHGELSSSDSEGGSEELVVERDAGEGEKVASLGEALFTPATGDKNAEAKPEKGSDETKDGSGPTGAAEDAAQKDGKKGDTVVQGTNAATANKQAHSPNASTAAAGTAAGATGTTAKQVVRIWMAAGGGGWATVFFISTILWQVIYHLQYVLLAKWVWDRKPAEVWDDPHLRRIDMIYILLYLALMVGTFVFNYLSAFSFIKYALTASKTLHNRMLRALIYSPSSFFDTTPLATITQRLGKDTESCDTGVPQALQTTISLGVTVVMMIVVVSILSPFCLIVFIPCAALYLFFSARFRRVMPVLKGIDGMTKYPIFSFTGETLSNLPTIRAYQVSEPFICMHRANLITNWAVSYPATTISKWLGFRINTIACFIAAGVSFVTVLTPKFTWMRRFAGIVMFYGYNTGGTLANLIQNFVGFESEAQAVGRIVDYTHLPQEAKPPSEEKKMVIPENWPAGSSSIVVRHLKFRYRAGLDIILKDVNFELFPGDHVGIVGRSGSGKSTITVAMFRFNNPEPGSKILVDGFDIVSQLNLHQARSTLSIIPQTPMLFAGTLRRQLCLYSQCEAEGVKPPPGVERIPDDVLWKVLEQVRLKDYFQKQPGGLDSKIAPNGDNLSAGQRQLVCVARALIKEASCVILDEATAAVDRATDQLIQETIRTTLRSTTVLSIAHRLDTIIDFDRILVVDKGMVAEYDTPANLLRDPTSIFSQLVDNTGEEMSAFLHKAALEMEQKRYGDSPPPPGKYTEFMWAKNKKLGGGLDEMLQQELQEVKEHAAELDTSIHSIDGIGETHGLTEEELAESGIQGEQARTQADVEPGSREPDEAEPDVSVSTSDAKLSGSSKPQKGGSKKSRASTGKGGDTEEPEVSVHSSASSDNSERSKESRSSKGSRNSASHGS